MMYENLAPFLNSKPLGANTVGPGRPIPRGGDPSRVNLALEALRLVLRFAGVPEVHSSSASMYIKWQMCKRAVFDLAARSSLESWDARLLHLAAKVSRLPRDWPEAMHLAQDQRCDISCDWLDALRSVPRSAGHVVKYL
jgi:hypothetical protein